MDTLVTDQTDVPGRVIQVGELEMFYLDAPGAAPPLVMLHGLSSNANAFTALVAAGLAPAFRVIAPDLRGRARTSKPATGYTMADHARDVIALLDALGIQRAVLCGHSFGGYLGIYVAANFPDRVEKLVVIDAALSTHPRVGELLGPSLERLNRVSDSVDADLAAIRSAPYMLGMWDDHIEQYFRAEMQVGADGSVRSATTMASIGPAMYGIAIEPWLHWIQQVSQPTLMINALEPFGPPGSAPLVDEVTARATARAFPDARYIATPGNHLTMVFGDAAHVVRDVIERFVRGETLPST